MKKQTVLILCTGNSCRSQMGEGMVNHYLGERWQAYSAGTEPSGYVHSLAVEAMAELGIDISDGRSQSADAYKDIPFDVVITVCGDAAENCPLWLQEGEVVHIGFADPKKATGSKEEQMAVFRQVRDQIQESITGLLEDGGGDADDRLIKKFSGQKRL